MIIINIYFKPGGLSKAVSLKHASLHIQVSWGVTEVNMFYSAASACDLGNECDD